MGRSLAPVTRPLPELAAQIRTEVDAADRDWNSALGHAIRAGALPIEAKAAVAHGEWLPWLPANGFEQQRASEFMRVAKLPDAGSLPSLRGAQATGRAAGEAVERSAGRSR
jgi:hypothetical protein